MSGKGREKREELLEYLGGGTGVRKVRVRAFAPRGKRGKGGAGVRRGERRRRERNGREGKMRQVLVAM